MKKQKMARSVTLTFEEGCMKYILKILDIFEILRYNDLEKILCFHKTQKEALLWHTNIPDHGRIAQPAHIGRA